MDISLNKKNSTEGSIKINLNADDYQPKVDEKVKEYSKKANIKGFRQGKVPSGVITKMYGKSIKVEEINHMLSHALNDYIKDNDIQLLGDPIPESDNLKDIDWETQSEFEFEYSIGMVDEFNYDLSNKNKVKKYVITVDNKTIKNTIEDLLKQHGKVSNPKKSEAGDAIYGTFSLEDKSNDSLLEMDDVVKKEQKRFIGLQKDSTIEFDIRSTLKDDLSIARTFSTTEEEAKNLKGTVSLVVKNINRKDAAELNQELFDKVFGKETVKTEEEFTEKIKTTIQENYGRESDFLLNKDIRKAIIKKTKMETPDEFLKRWLLLSNEGKISENEINKDFEHYLNDLKWNLISNKIFKDLELKVENNDVVEEARNQIIGQFGGPAVADVYKDQLDGIVQNHLKAENGKNYMNIFNQLTGNKVMVAIRERISILEKKVSLDEFKKLAAA